MKVKVTNIYLVLLFLVAYIGNVTAKVPDGTAIKEGINTKSVIEQKLDDRAAVYFTSANFDMQPNDGKPDAKSLQRAINQVAKKEQKFGIVFIPEGKYVINKTVHVWKGVRLIGYGQDRPEFVLSQGTKGFQEGKNKYMIHFVDDMPKEGEPIRGANPGTFYSALNNINFIIREGNSGAVAIKSHFAQHSFIANAIFNMKSGKAAIEEVGNIIRNCKFIGGKYGIIATKTSPSWPFMLKNSYFESQKKAAISTEEAGFTVTESYFKNVPYVVSVNKNRLEELFIGNTYFNNIEKAGILISDEYNSRAQYNLKNIRAKNVNTLAKFRKSGKKILKNKRDYFLKNFCHGNQIKGPQYKQEIKTTFNIDPQKGDEKSLIIDTKEIPESQEWVNIKDLGAKGDGKTDNTEILKKAIENHKAIYLPTGRYLVSETIELDQNTSIIGLNPITTQIRLKNDLEIFQGVKGPKPLIETPPGGENVVSGIGISTGAKNNRAVAITWQSGKKSLLNDVKILGGHGTYNPNGSYVDIYNKFHTGDPYLDREWNSQYGSIWVTDGGGGTFQNIWTANPYSKAGLYITNTKTKGRIFAMSSEHHVENEIIFKDSKNWKIHALQMEEEKAEGEENALPIYIENSSNLSFRNTFFYRVIDMEKPYPYAIKSNGSKNIEFCGVHSYTPTKYNFSNILYLQSKNFKLRPHEIARLHLTKKSQNRQSQYSSNRVQKVVEGFEFIDGSTVDKEGNVYFIDSRLERVYRWNVKQKRLEQLLEVPVKPVALAFDNSGNLLITTSTNEVLTFHPDNNPEKLEKLEVVKPANHQGKVAILPAHRWRDEMHDFVKINTYSQKNPPVTKSSYNMAHDIEANPLEKHFISKAGNTFIPNLSDLIRAFSLKRAVPGEKFYMVDEFRQKTYRFTVNKDGSLSNPELFAEKGEFDVKVGPDGKVYIPTGDIYIYNKSGQMIDKIHIPERPSTLVFGGPHRKTAYITAGSSLYKVNLR